jgi:hypothetical protein
MAARTSIAASARKEHAKLEVRYRVNFVDESERDPRLLEEAGGVHRKGICHQPQEVCPMVCRAANRTTASNAHFRFSGLGAIAAPIALIVMPVLLAGEQRLAAAQNVSLARQTHAPTVQRLSERPSQVSEAKALSGTVGQPYRDELLLVPVPPPGPGAASTGIGGSYDQAPPGIGGPIEPTASPGEVLFEINQNLGETPLLPPYPVIESAEQPAADRANVINLIVP